MQSPYVNCWPAVLLARGTEIWDFIRIEPVSGGVAKSDRVRSIERDRVGERSVIFDLVLDPLFLSGCKLMIDNPSLVSFTDPTSMALIFFRPRSPPEAWPKEEVVTLLCFRLVMLSRE